MFFKILFYLLFLVGIVFTIFSNVKYKSLDSIEKECKQQLFLSRTKFVILIGIVNIIILIFLFRFFGELARYFFLVFFLFWSLFDFFDSKNKIEIMKENNFSSNFLSEYKLSTSYQTIGLFCFFILIVMAFFKN
ncbi:MAG: hypothetical protein RSE15_02770 [Flavobacterium sp.]|jgi:hypothetical protein|uniref:hypothetical protein n=1 Tax=Flavobacterium sp. TaxID=239 RepID=UPI002978CD58|nr:hypothetical protein [Flavobacterium sp.]TAF10836.1 MAG: hypothetical protein EAZ75_04835 [Flavobacteriia bacterium]WRH73764.1 MAG: hypothetical protein RSE15_02770 [Flavobacterium sp.]